MANLNCPKCGEEYSDTYKKCPFCQEEEARKKGRTVRRRGRRLNKRRRSGGAGGVIMLLAVIIIFGVVGYVFFGEQLANFAGIRTGDDRDDLSQMEDDDRQNALPDEDAAQTGPDDTQGGTPDVPDEPAGPLTLSQSDITIPAGETGLITATGGTGEVQWTSSNINIATVDGGSVTGVAGGTVTITAQSGEETATCSVTITGDPWVSDADLSLNRTDFTLSAGDPPFQMKVKGTDSPVVWASNNPNVAVISESGVVSRGSQKGTHTITATVDGHVLECIVRVP